MEPQGTLALDLSSRVGWCWAEDDANLPQCGTFELPRLGGEGARYAAFAAILRRTIAAVAPARMLLEAPLSFAALMGVSTARTVQQQYTLRGIAFMEAYNAAIPCEEVSAEIVRGALLGQSRFAKGTVKKIVMDYCRQRGVRVRDDNAADACMLWWWHRGQMRGSAPVAGPLFRERMSL